MGEIRFYEGTECTQHYIGKISSELDSSWDLTLRAAPVPNGEALSCTLIDVKKGARIMLFDTAENTGEDTCTEIIVKADVEQKCIPRFTAILVDPYVEVKLHGGKGVQGKVSRIQVQSV